MPSTPGEPTDCYMIGRDHRIEMWKIREGHLRDSAGRFLSGKIIGIRFDKRTRLTIRCRDCGTEERLPVTWLGSAPSRSDDFPWR